MLGRPIKVEYSQPRPGGDRPKSPRGDRKPFEQSEMPEGCVTVFLGNLSYDIDDDATKEFFKVRIWCILCHSVAEGATDPCHANVFFDVKYSC